MRGDNPNSQQNNTGVDMLKKIIIGMLLVATMVFGMSLSKLNSASKAELMEINGIGEVKATEIIKQRRKGKFKSFADLQERVDGIGEQTAANIKGGVKNAEDVKKVVKKKTTKSKVKTDAKKKVTKKTKAKSKKKSRTRAKTKSSENNNTVTKKKKPRKTKTKKTKTKKTKTRKTKTKTKTKN